MSEKKYRPIVFHDDLRGIEFHIEINEDGKVPSITMTYEEPRGLGEFINYTSMHTPMFPSKSNMGKQPRKIQGNPKSMLNEDGTLPHPVLDPNHERRNLTGSSKSFVMPIEEED